MKLRTTLLVLVAVLVSFSIGRRTSSAQRPSPPVLKHASVVACHAESLKCDYAGEAVGFSCVSFPDRQPPFTCFVLVKDE
jgi:hypothetical protein